MRFQEFNLVMGGIWVRQTRSKVTSCGSNEDEWNWKPPPPPLPGSTESTETATAAGCYPPEELDDEVPYDYPSADFSNATFSAYLLQAGFVQDPLRYHSSPHRQKIRKRDHPAVPGQIISLHAQVGCVFSPVLAVLFT